MKSLYTLLALIAFYKVSFTQTGGLEPFKVKGNAKLIATWAGPANTVTGTLSSGDVILFKWPQSVVNVYVVHNNIPKLLVGTSQYGITKGKEDIEKNAVIKVYEYDFGGDGQKEIIVIHSRQFAVTTVEVFRYSAGLVEKVGNFAAQIQVNFQKNMVSLPFGSFGSSNDYLYMKGAFYQLVYHDPNKTTLPAAYK